MGNAVPTARRRRNEEVLPANAMCDMVEKRKAERPKPDMTIPVAEPRYKSIISEQMLGDVGLVTVLSGNVFAVEFTELVRPPLPPDPVKYPHNTKRENVDVEIVLAPGGTPESKMYWMPR